MVLSLHKLCLLSKVKKLCNVKFKGFAKVIKVHLPMNVKLHLFKVSKDQRVGDFLLSFKNGLKEIKLPCCSSICFYLLSHPISLLTAAHRHHRFGACVLVRQKKEVGEKKEPKQSQTRQACVATPPPYRHNTACSLFPTKRPQTSSTRFKGGGHPERNTFQQRPSPPGITTILKTLLQGASQPQLDTQYHRTHCKPQNPSRNSFKIQSPSQI